MRVWFNGKLVDELNLPASNASWLVGDGVFETIKTYQGSCFFLAEHLARMAGSLATLSMTSPNMQDLENAISELLASDDVHGYGRLRITIFADGNTLMTHEGYLPNDAPVSLCRYPKPRASFSAMSGHKTISYGENFTALRFAKAKQCDDVLYFNEKGQAIESAVANLIYFLEGGWFTPTLQSGCLPGITRRLLIDNFKVRERDLHFDEMFHCEALALTSSLREVVVVQAYEGKLYPSFKPLEQLQGSFNDWTRDKLSR